MVERTLLPITRMERQVGVARAHSPVHVTQQLKDPAASGVKRDSSQARGLLGRRLLLPWSCLCSLGSAVPLLGTWVLAALGFLSFRQEKPAAVSTLCWTLLVLGGRSDSPGSISFAGQVAVVQGGGLPRGGRGTGDVQRGRKSHRRQLRITLSHEVVLRGPSRPGQSRLAVQIA